MAHLEDLTPDTLVSGITGAEPVTVSFAKWYGSGAVGITYKDSSGRVGQQVLTRADEPSLAILSDHLPWSFDADGDRMRLVSEAYRIHFAHLFDPYLAVHTSAVEPLPHQIAAVYQKMLPRLPLRYVLADDPGAGKTIMTGLYIKEMLVRGDLKRCLIVSPGSLVEQWQDELQSKFHLRFEILTNDRIDSAPSGNVFTEVDLAICRLDKLARNEELQAKLKASDWDLIVCDEAHKMSATVWGDEVKYTHRYQLGQLLSTLTRNFLLLTATPHNGKEKDFQLFLALIDADRFEGVRHSSAHKAVDASDIMRRLVKEELLTFEGKPLFPERRAYTLNYDFSEPEAELYAAVTEYVRAEFNRADHLRKDRKNTVGFALTILQRRLASSPEAIYQSLKRRRQRLEQRLEDMRFGRVEEDDCAKARHFDDVDEDDFTSAEQEDWEEQVVDRATAAATIKELEAEIGTLLGLEQLANDVRVSGIDRKWDELSKLLQSPEFRSGIDGVPEKLIIFTEHRDTLNYLTDKISSLLGHPEAVVTIHGGLRREERHKAEELFKQDIGVRVMIATDAAGEGINLQRAHLMINYDLPWNPNRLEQRFGRIHRIGQTEVCQLWNLVASGSREGMVFQRLFSKLEEERKALGGKVFDVLGSLTFDNKSLRDLLIEAVRAGNEPEVRARMQQVVDKTMDPAAFQKLIDERALTEDVMNIDLVQSIREEMERREARKLQPHFIESFFKEAFQGLGGKVRPAEPGRCRLDSVPLVLQNRHVRFGQAKTVLKRYERVCFDKAYCTLPGQAKADLMCPGHPLMDAVVSVVREQNADVLKRGTVFIDESDYSREARLLVYIQSDIQDGLIDRHGQRRPISRQFHFVEIKEDGSSLDAGYAPYLDYRTATETEQEAIKGWLQRQAWLTSKLEDKAETFAIQHLVLPHLQEVKDKRLAIIAKTAKAVKERLTEEIQYWDSQANELAEKEALGKTNDKLNSANARRRADDLEMRRDKRLADLKQEEQISALPPLIAGGALVIPLGLLHELTGTPLPLLNGQHDRQAIEDAAMKAVMQIECRLGYLPRDVSADKCGYDVESRVPEPLQGEQGTALRMIEVKGRTAGADTVTVSKNEILTALNKPESFILALVEVDGTATRTLYLKHPFSERPDFSATSVNFDMQDLIANAEVVWRDEG